MLLLARIVEEHIQAEDLALLQDQPAVEHAKLMFEALRNPVSQVPQLSHFARMARPNSKTIELRHRFSLELRHGSFLASILGG